MGNMPFRKLLIFALALMLPYLLLSASLAFIMLFFKDDPGISASTVIGDAFEGVWFVYRYLVAALLIGGVLLYANGKFLKQKQRTVSNWIAIPIIIIGAFLMCSIFFMSLHINHDWSV